MKEKIKILSLSDSYSVPTGYSRVMREIVSRMDPERYEWHHFGTNTQGMPGFESIDYSMYWKSNEQIYEEAKAQGFAKNAKSFSKWFSKNFQRALTLGKNADGGDIYQYHKDSVKPDVCFFLKDLWMYNWVLNVDFSPAKSLFYYPMDGYPVPQDCHKHLLKCDVSVAMSKFGKQVVEEYEYCDEIDGKYYNLKNRLTSPVHYIPHGVSSDVFKPLKENEIEQIKQSNGLENQFVVGIVGRNQPRKSHSILIKAFKKFSEGKNDVSLYLHCDMKDPNGNNLYAQLKNHKITKFKFTIMNSYKYGVPDRILNHIYNCFSVHAPIGSGEGFGIPIIESQACGIPNILVDYTTSAELLNHERDTAFYPGIFKMPQDNIVTKQGILTPAGTMITGSMNVERAIGDTQAVVDALQYMYDNPSEVKKMGRTCRKFALDYDWDIIAKQWDKLFQETVQK